MLLPSADSGCRGIEDGDLAIVYERFDCMKAVTVTDKGSYGNKFGNFAMKDWIGKPFGTKMRAKPPNTGWVYVLAPTPELWTQVLRHRTQILYVADISMVCTMLELQPGCIVLESGTGSGSLTTSLARAVAPTGHVYTFEFHGQRAGTAAEEFKQNGLGDVITVTQRDIEGQGFPEDLHGKADALFLDLPGPWKVVPSASQCLRPDGVFCSFSPCIEQVQRTCEALNANGFRDMRTMEVLLRQYEVTSENLITDLVTLQQQLRGGQQQRRQDGTEAQPNKRQRTGSKPQQQQNGVTAEAQPEPSSEEQAAQALQQGGSVEEDGAVLVAETKPENEQAGEDNEVGVGAAAAETREEEGGQQVWQQPRERRVLARPVAQGRGHTGYLTFARKAVV